MSPSIDTNQTAAITMRGIRVHNLKSIDVEIPLGRLTVVTGVSGAGKSSLVFDTLYAEAQRRYLQGFSTYIRQFLDRFDKPDADEISDLPPAIAIRGAARSKVSVGALPELADDLRFLFARAGVVACPTCGGAVASHRADDIANVLAALPVGTRATIAFPSTCPDGGDPSAWLASLREEGYLRIQVGAQVHRLDDPFIPNLAAGEQVLVLLDRIETGTTSLDRISESIELAFRRGGGRVCILTPADTLRFHSQPTCTLCELGFPPLEARLFDSSDPLGACPACLGTGTAPKSTQTCDECLGRRWNRNALSVRIQNRHIADWHQPPISQLAAFLMDWIPPGNRSIAARRELMQRRLELLVDLELGHLRLGDPSTGLSTGELKRIALASALASDLVNVLYLIDEPTVGLHQRDLGKLVAALTTLRDRGNTVVVIEHDREVISAADHVIDLGPGAGAEGGAVVYQGPPPEPSVSIETPTRRRKPNGFVSVTTSNPDTPSPSLSVELPLGVFGVVTGPTGAGKRHLLERVLFPALGKRQGKDGPFTTKVAGAHRINDVVWIDQEPLTRSSRSNPASYLKIFDEIRTLFAEATDARIRNFTPGHFSFNQPGGRCDACEGHGTLTIDMQFLGDVVSTCPECLGRRYRPGILEIRVRSLNIAEVLNLTIREAFRFFRAQPKIEKKLKWLIDVGLDYLRLGQQIETLAGSECQRLKLAAHLAGSRKTGVLFLLSEPSAGLHLDDIASLLECLDRLLASGHSVIATENDSEVIRCADWIIELGPGDVSERSRLIAAGTPEDIAKVPESPTGRMLAALA